MAKTQRFQYKGSNGQIVKPYADAGAARGESLPVYECNSCGRLVVWATSKRTGRKYLVQVARHTYDGMTVDSFWYNAGSVHNDETCQREQDRRAEDTRHFEEQAEKSAKAAETTRQAYLDCLAEAEASGDAEYIRRVRRAMEIVGVTE